MECFSLYQNNTSLDISPGEPFRRLQEKVHYNNQWCSEQNSYWIVRSTGLLEVSFCYPIVSGYIGDLSKELISANGFQGTVGGDDLAALLSLIHQQDDKDTFFFHLITFPALI